jgi:chemotaxis protein CheX
MGTITEEELRLFVDSVKRYFQVTTKQEPSITSAYLGTDSIEGHEFNGIVSFSGSYDGHVIVSMPPRLLRELLLLQQETDLSDDNLLDAVKSPTRSQATRARAWARD